MVEITGYLGPTDINIGDRFNDGHGVTWEVVEICPDMIDSSFGAGSVPVVRCRVVNAVVPATTLRLWGEYLNDDRTARWCGDAVSSLLIKTRGKP